MLFLDYDPVQGAYLDAVVPCTGYYLLTITILLILGCILFAICRYLQKIAKHPEVTREFMFCSICVMLFLLVVGGLEVHYSIRNYQETTIKQDPKLKPLYEDFTWELVRQKNAIREIRKKRQEEQEKVLNQKENNDEQP